MEFRFGTISIVELGNSISNKLREDGITNKSELIVYLSDNEFRKVDEDLYYRNRKDDSEEFVPSDNEIIVNFEMVKIIVKKEERE